MTESAEIPASASKITSSAGAFPQLFVERHRDPSRTCELEQDYPDLKQNMLSAMGNLNPGRLLDTRFLDSEIGSNTEPELFPIVTE